MRIFPTIPDNKVRESKAMISMHTSNSFHDCDRMFIPDWMTLDETVQKMLEQKANNIEELLGSMG